MRLICLAGALSCATAVPARDERPPVPTLVLQTPHFDAVTCAAFSPHGKLIASGGRDRMVKLWDRASGVLLLTLPAPAEVRRIALTEELITAECNDESVMVWESRSGRLVKVSRNAHISTAPVSDRIKAWPIAFATEQGAIDKVSKIVAFSPDGRLLAVASSGNTIEIRDTASNAPQRELPLEDAAVAMAFSPDSLTLAVATGGFITLWDVRSGEITGTINHTLGKIEFLAFSGEGRELLSGGRHGLIVTSTADHSRFRTLSALVTPRYRGSCFIDSGNHLINVVATNINRFRIWNLTSPRLVQTIQGRLTNSAATNNLHVTRSPDGKHILVWDHGRRSGRVIDVQTGRTCLDVAGFDGWPRFEFSQDGKRLLGHQQVTENLTHRVQVWDLEANNAVFPTPRVFTVERASQAAPIAKPVTLSSQSPIGTVIGPIKPPSPPPPAKAIPVAMGITAWSGTFDVALLTTTNRVPGSGQTETNHKFWHIRSGRMVSLLVDPRQDLYFDYYAIAFSTDGRLLARVVLDKPQGSGLDKPLAILIADTSTGRVVTRIPLARVEATGIDKIRFAADDKTVLAVSKRVRGIARLRAWNAATQQQLVALDDKSGSEVEDVLSAGRLSSGEKLVMTLDKPARHITITELSTGKAQSTWLLPQSTVHFAAALSPAGDTVITREYDGDGRVNFRVWDVKSGRLRGTLESPEIHEPGEMPRFSPNGRLLPLRTLDGRVQLWDIRTCRIAATLTMFESDGGGKPSESAKDQPYRLEPVPGEDWLITTPEGYFECSAGAQRYLRWYAGGQFVDTGRTYKRLHRPDLLRKIMRGLAA